MARILKFKSREEKKLSNLENLMPKIDDLRHLINDASKLQGEQRTVFMKTVNREFDAIIDEMLPANTQELKDESLLDRIRTHHPLTVEAMEKLPEEVVPLVVVRELVSRYRLQVDQKSLKNWKRFVTRYRGVIAA